VSRGRGTEDAQGVNGWIFAEGEGRDFEKAVWRTREGLVLEEKAEMGLSSLLAEPTEPWDPAEGGRVLMSQWDAVMRGKMGAIKKRSNGG
jgi:hypothetical protein